VIEEALHVEHFARERSTWSKFAVAPQTTAALTLPSPARPSDT
jgi:hypothetical protein